MHYSCFIGIEYNNGTKNYVKKDFDPAAVKTTKSINTVYNWICNEVRVQNIPVLTVVPNAHSEMEITKNNLQGFIEVIKKIQGDDFNEKKAYKTFSQFEGRIYKPPKEEFETISPEQIRLLKNRYNKDKRMRNYINPFDLQPQMS